MSKRLEGIITRTTIDIPGKTHMETDDFKWLIRRVEQLEGLFREMKKYLDDDSEVTWEVFGSFAHERMEKAFDEEDE